MVFKIVTETITRPLHRMKNEQVGEFLVLGPINQMKYNKVHRGKHVETGIKVLIKDFEIHGDPELMRTKESIRWLVYHEVDVLKLANCKFVVKLLDFEEKNDHVYVIEEGLENGTIMNLVGKYEIPVKEEQRIIAQLVAGLDYLHNQLRICHRNISHESVYLDTYYNIRFSDFTHSAQILREGDTLTSVCGSHDFRAPEMLPKQRYTKAVDVWSLGVLIYYMVEGKKPFMGHTDHETRVSIRTKDPKFSRRLSPDLVDLLKQMLNKDPSARIRTEELKLHKYFSGVDFDELMRAPAPISDDEVKMFLEARGAPVTPASQSVAKAFMLSESMQSLGSRVPYVEMSVGMSRAVSAHVMDSEWKRKAIANGIARGHGKFMSRKSGNWTDASTTSSDFSSDSFLVTRSDGNL